MTSSKDSESCLLMTLIEVKPNLESLLWTVCIDGVEVGRQENSVDCDAWANHFAKAYTDVVIERHRETRWKDIEALSNARKERKKINKTVGDAGSEQGKTA